MRIVQVTHAIAENRVRDARDGAAQSGARFYRAEAEQRNIRGSPRRFSRATVGLGAVFDHKDTPLSADGDDPFQINADSEKVSDNQHAGSRSNAGREGLQRW